MSHFNGRIFIQPKLKSNSHKKPRLCLIEHPPQRRTIQFGSGGYIFPPYTQKSILFPYLQFITGYSNSLFVSMSKTSIIDNDDVLVYPSYASYGEFSNCMGFGVKGTPESDEKSTFEYAMKHIHHYWSSVFVDPGWKKWTPGIKCTTHFTASRRESPYLRKQVCLS